MFTGTAPKNLGNPLDPKLDENTVRENYRNNPRIIKIKKVLRKIHIKTLRKPSKATGPNGIPLR